MHIGYLVNIYPKPSHSFIRREIQALEALGVTVSRFSLHRAADSDLVDPRDRSEAKKTRIIMANGTLGLVISALGVFVRRPLRGLSGLWRALKLGWGSERGSLVHGAYWLEALVVGAGMQRAGVEHVHAHFGTNPAMIALLIDHMFGLGFSFTVHGPEEFDRPRFLNLPDKIKAARFTVGISSFGCSQMMRLVPYAYWDRLREVHCGLDDVFLGAPVTGVPGLSGGAPDGLPEIVCVGRLCEQKGQAILLDAVARLKESGQLVKLTLAGDGEMREEIEARIAELSLSEQVVITGWISSDDVRAHILRARALVLPSFAEGLPVVLMEALALARPVVTTYVAGIPELVKPGENGWLVAAGSVPALTEALADMLASDTVKLSAMGVAGRAAACARHNALTEAGKLKNCFEQALQK